MTARYKGMDVNAATVQNLLRTINSMSKRTKRQSATDDALTKIRSIIGLYRPQLIKRGVDVSVPELVIEALAAPVPSITTHNFNYKYDYGGGAASIPHQSYDAFGQPIASAPPPPSPFAPPPEQQPRQRPQTRSNQEPSLEPMDLEELNGAIENTCKRLDTDSMKALVSTLVKMSDKYFKNNTFAEALKRLYCFDRRYDEAQRSANDMEDLLACINKNTNRDYRDLSQICNILSSLYETCKQLYIRFFNLSSELEFDTIDLDRAAAEIVSRVDRLRAYERAYSAVVLATSDMRNPLVEFPDTRLMTVDLDNFNEQLVRFLTTRTINLRDEERQRVEREDRYKNDIAELKRQTGMISDLQRDRDELSSLAESYRVQLEALRERAKNDKDEFEDYRRRTEETQRRTVDEDKLVAMYKTLKSQYDDNLRAYEQLVAHTETLNRRIEALTAECDRENVEGDEIRMLKQTVNALRDTQADDQATISTLTQTLERYQNNYLQSVINQQTLGYESQVEQLNAMRSAYEQQKMEIERVSEMLRQQLDENRILQEARARARAAEAQIREQMSDMEIRHQAEIDKFKTTEKAPANELVMYSERRSSPRSRPYNTRSRKRRAETPIETPESPSQPNSLASGTNIPWHLVSRYEAYPVTSNVTIPTQAISDTTADQTLITTAAASTAQDESDDPYAINVRRYSIIREILDNPTALTWTLSTIVDDIENSRPSYGYAYLVRRLGVEAFVKYVNRFLSPDRLIGLSRNILNLIRADYENVQRSDTSAIDEVHLREQQYNMINRIIVDYQAQTMIE
ncbi:hypothetical protein SlsnVgp062 [Spodoptera littoralis nucleopolyhedrovirus]|uniref:Viral desmoplakin N-terminal domain-containing protein n=1 Tax=Spodoptera littoralis nuclear polyhedrosis virus TaxID=10456 RepID=M1JSK0_NPVSL|nr:hypothetical protein SlsnVgp062 [Spodoptera littoralis nucleopolyhedrovirus]AGE89917.1 hypothetical protein SlsnVgp062 [Spodoptera littoralis nucleopolyhedrovirus]